MQESARLTKNLPDAGSIGVHTLQTKSTGKCIILLSTWVCAQEKQPGNLDAHGRPYIGYEQRSRPSALFCYQRPRNPPLSRILLFRMSSARSVLPYEIIGLMDRLTVIQCKKLIEHSAAEAMTEDEVVVLRDTLYAIGEIVAEAFADLGHIDQQLFNPKNDVYEWLEGRGERQ